MPFENEKQPFKYFFFVLVFEIYHFFLPCKQFKFMYTTFIFFQMRLQSAAHTRN